MAYQPFQRSHYRGGGGAGFGGNAWVSLMGGAAQGLLSAQKNRAELIQQAQQEALRRAAEQRAIDAAQREEKRLEMARKESDARARALRKAEEERQAEIRKARDEEMRQRARATSLVEEWGADEEISGYWTPTELETLAQGVAGGKISPDKVRPPKPKTGTDLNFYATPAASRGISAAQELEAWDRQFLGEERGGVRLPPAQENVIFGPDNQPVTDWQTAYQTKLIPDLQRKIAELQRIVATSEPGSNQWYEARRRMEQADAILKAAMARLTPRTGDLGQVGGANPYAGVNTSPGR
jgi:hypothetical protein